MINRLDEKEFDSLKEEWNALLSRSASDNVFLRWEWIHSWWDIFKNGLDLMILAVKEEDRLIGIAPFYVQTRGLMRIRSLRLCSEELSPDYMDVIALKGREADVLTVVGGYLADHSREWDEIRFDNLLEESLLFSRFSLPPEYPMERQHAHTCPYVRLDRQPGLRYPSRNELKSFRLEKKFQKLVKDKNVIHSVVQDEPRRLKGMHDLFRLHAERSKNRHRRSNFISEDVRRFHQAVSREFLREGILNLQLLYAGQAPVAASYAFNYRNKVYYYQGGFDPEYSSWSAGTLVIHLSVVKAFDDGFREFDFLKGDEGYKSLWANAAREEMLLVVYSQTWRGSLWRRMRKTRSFLGRLRRRVRGMG